MNDKRRHPFGEVSCESELRTYQEEYQSLYFDEAPFNRMSLSEERYLIVGRRGTGKSSLVQYFNFQEEIQKSRYIEIDNPKIYSSALERISSAAAASSELAIDRLVEIWGYLVWAAIFDDLYEFDSAIRNASALEGRKNKPSEVIKASLDYLLKNFLGSNTSVIGNALEQYLRDPIIQKAKKEVVKITREIPIIIAIDSLERYDINDEAIMWSTAALIQFASSFNEEYSTKGLHLKVFVTTEIFPVIRDQVIQNVSKYVRDPVFLH